MGGGAEGLTGWLGRQSEDRPRPFNYPSSVICHYHTNRIYHIAISRRAIYFRGEKGGEGGGRRDEPVAKEIKKQRDLLLFVLFVLFLLVG